MLDLPRLAIRWVPHGHALFGAALLVGCLVDSFAVEPGTGNGTDAGTSGVSEAAGAADASAMAGFAGVAGSASLLSVAGGAGSTHVPGGAGGAGSPNALGGAGSAGAPDSTGSRCGAAGGGPADMAILEATGGGCFWMDKTEVTVDGYRRFLDDMAGVSGSPAEEGCEGNDLVPLCDEGSLSGGAGGGGNLADAEGDHPIVCVDWCDAKAYCSWTGKRLCGDQEEWFSACTNGTLTGTSYPYGNDYEPARCNGSGAGEGRAVAESEYAGCSSEAGILHLSGNVSEWTDSSEQVRGGNFRSEREQLKCDMGLAVVSPFTRRSFIGFRCCADAG